MRVQLRRGIAVDRTAAVVLELGDGPRARRLRRDVAADARLRVLLHLVERRAHALPVGLSHAVVAANQAQSARRDFGALNVASHPARCSIVRTVSPCAFTYSRAV